MGLQIVKHSLLSEQQNCKTAQYLRIFYKENFQLQTRTSKSNNLSNMNPVWRWGFIITIISLTHPIFSSLNATNFCPLIWPCVPTLTHYFYPEIASSMNQVLTLNKDLTANSLVCTLNTSTKHLNVSQMSDRRNDIRTRSMGLDLRYQLQIPAGPLVSCVTWAKCFKTSFTLQFFSPPIQWDVNHSQLTGLWWRWVNPCKASRTVPACGLNFTITGFSLYFHFLEFFSLSPPSEDAGLL